MSSSRSKTTSRLALLAGAVGLLSAGCASNAPQDSLRPAGPESRFIQNLFVPVFFIAVFFFVVVWGGVGFIAWKYRMRSEDDAPVQLHGSAKLEIAWTIVPALILIGVGIASVAGVFHLFKKPSGQPLALVPASASSSVALQGDYLNVNVFAHRWWFEFRYPGLGANGSELITAGDLHIPAGRAVRLNITSVEYAGGPEGGGAAGSGVIHNFWVPRLAGKIYAEPGHTTHLNIQADKPGTYKGQCTEFCGISHANMRFQVVADAAPDFAAWVGNQQQPAKVFSNADQFASADANAGYELFNSTAGCAVCHSVNGTPAVGGFAPNLTHLQARTLFAGDSFPLDDVHLREWLRNPQALKPGANMKIRKLTEEEITQLIAYLDTLK